jgi:uncharacterized RmlC-like cupin family protein
MLCPGKLLRASLNINDTHTKVQVFQLVHLKMRWGEHLEYVADAGPGDFIYVPPFVPHQEINASGEEPLSCVLVRSGQEPIVVNLEIAPAEPPEEVYWVDDLHSPPS